MLYNDNDKNKKKKPGFNAQAFKHAIGMIESSGGKNMWNNNTSATGKYQFLYKLIKDDPDMKGVSRREFLKNSELQEKIMDKALNGSLKGFVYGTNYANKIKKQYNSDYGTEDITALLHFLGPGDARKFLKNPDAFKVKGVNKTPQDYISKFRGMYDEHPSQIKAMEEFNRAPAYDIYNDDSSIGNLSMPTPPKQEMPYREFMPEQRDNTQVRTPKNIPMQPVGQPAEFDMNSFKYGGQMKDSGGANDLVTMFEGGGSHEQNPLGGIPQGVGSDGAPNLVEEGETKWNDYIFSNAISVDGVMKDSGADSNSYKQGGYLDPTDPPKDKKKSKKTSGYSLENIWEKTKEYGSEFISEAPDMLGKIGKFADEEVISPLIDKVTDPKTYDSALNIANTVGRNVYGNYASGDLKRIIPQTIAPTYTIAKDLIPSTGVSFGKFILSNMAKKAGILPEKGSALFNVDESDLSPEDIRAYREMLTESMSTNNPGVLDYSNYTNDKKSPKKSSKALSFLKSKHGGAGFLKAQSGFSGEDGLKEALSQLTGNVSYYRGEDGNIYIKDSYDFHNSRKDGKEGFSLGEVIDIYDKYKEGSFGDSWSISHLIAEASGGHSMPMDINIGNYKDVGLTKEQFEKLKKYKKNENKHGLNALGFENSKNKKSSEPELAYNNQKDNKRANSFRTGGQLNGNIDPPIFSATKPSKTNNPASTENVVSRFYGESDGKGLSNTSNGVGIDSFSGNKNYNGFSIPENTSPGQGLLNSMDAFKTQASYPQPKVKTYPYSESADRKKNGSTFYLEDKTKNYLDSEGNVALNGAAKDEGSQAFLDRYNNEWSRARLAEQSNMTQKDIDNSIIRGMEAKKEIGGNKPGSKGEYKDDVNTVYLEKDDKNVEVHERIHASLFDESQGNYLQGILGNAFQQGEDQFPGEGKNMDRATKKYMNTPSETYANFAEFREKLGLKPGQQLTKQQYLKLVKEKGASNENFFKTYNDDNIIKALNTVAYQGQENNDYENYRLA